MYWQSWVRWLVKFPSIELLLAKSINTVHQKHGKKIIIILYNLLILVHFLDPASTHKKVFVFAHEIFFI